TRDGTSLVTGEVRYVFVEAAGAGGGTLGPGNDGSSNGGSSGGGTGTSRTGTSTGGKCAIPPYVREGLSRYTVS
nr:hypothetical protein [Micromonospora sp. DSM 115978]